jgi:hypothetical protein
MVAHSETIAPRGMQLGAEGCNWRLVIDGMING